MMNVHTISSRPVFRTDSTYNDVTSNYCCVWNILTLNRRSFTNLFVWSAAFTQLESIVDIVLFFTFSNCPNIELSLLFGGTISALLSRKSSFTVEVFMLVLSTFVINMLVLWLFRKSHLSHPQKSFCFWFSAGWNFRSKWAGWHNLTTLFLSCLSHNSFMLKMIQHYFFVLYRFLLLFESGYFY